MAAQFEKAEGRRPRILFAKIGSNGHDREQKDTASVHFADDFRFAIRSRTHLLVSGCTEQMSQRIAVRTGSWLDCGIVIVTQPVGNV
jgi:hypothetical protein